MSRRNSETAECVAQYVQGTYKDWTVIGIHEKPHDEVIEIMNKSKIFLSFGGPEGFGIPPVEAALAGCKVIGYHGYGGQEYFDKPLFTEIPLMEILRFIDHIDMYTKVLAAHNPLEILTGAREQRIRLKNMYSLENFRSDIITGFSSMVLKSK